ncbi:hypothetical protein B5M09_013835 [Aphanomyces astaci]|uniref:Uncharacterized protein n=1 Tax=Aphanomyces astaci TaxID=112090 RepID=A0A425DFB1_APHAT|nr:hypothetical protein B5M09_013835 [Aphanomyces astaci]
MKVYSVNPEKGVASARRATPRGGGLHPSNQDSNAAYESIDVLDGEELRRDGAIDSVDVVVSDQRSISSRPGAMRLIPVAVRRLLASNSGTSNDNRSDTTTATTETYESHATPTNVVTDVDGLLPLDLDKESSVHRKLYKDRLKDATNVIQRTNLTPADMSAHVAALQQKALRRLDVCDLDRNCVPDVLDVVHAMLPLHDKK